MFISFDEGVTRVLQGIGPRITAYTPRHVTDRTVVSGRWLNSGILETLGVAIFLH